MDREQESQNWRVGLDIGGTFTDVVFLGPDGRVSSAKVLTTPDDHSRAVIDGVKRLLQQSSLPPREIQELVHGTTVATNAILEKRGARTALITTAGFRDILEIRRVRMPQLYNIRWQKPEPLVPRFLRYEVNERIDSGGNVLVPLDRDQLHEVIEELWREEVQSVAICLINAYLNPDHERQIETDLRESLPGVRVSVASDISQELKEFERTSTTVIDAYVKPIVEGYLSALEERLRKVDVSARLLVMQSNGAVMSVGAAREQPCYLIESGPAAGVIAGRALAERVGEPDLVTFDMGGTTAKAALIQGGRVELTDEYEVGAGLTVGTRLMKGDGYLLRIPAIDLAEVGAGGGSIARVDQGGRLQVGPRSAGAVPGPACYGLGGEEPTITDANVVLGYIAPGQFVGKTVTVDAERAHHVLRQIGGKLGMSQEDAALAVHLVGNARMSRPIRAVTVERGLDVRSFALLAFGGSGPIHAASLAAELGIKRIVVPPLAGVFSAVGLCQANAGHHVVRTFKHSLDRLSSDQLLAEVGALKAETRRRLDRLNYPAGDLHFEISADMRYAGQGFSLTVDLTGILNVGDNLIAKVQEAFATQHERTYGHRADQDPIEIVNLRLRAWVDMPAIWPSSDDVIDSSAPLTRSRKMLFQREVGLVETPILSRAGVTNRIDGPLAIEEEDTTIVVPPGWSARLDEWGNVRIDRGETQDER